MREVIPKRRFPTNNFTNCTQAEVFIFSLFVLFFFFRRKLSNRKLEARLKCTCCQTYTNHCRLLLVIPPSDPLHPIPEHISTNKTDNCWYLSPHPPDPPPHTHTHTDTQPTPFPTSTNKTTAGIYSGSRLNKLLRVCHCPDHRFTSLLEIIGRELIFFLPQSPPPPPPTKTVRPYETNNFICFVNLLYTT